MMFTNCWEVEFWKSSVRVKCKKVHLIAVILEYNTYSMLHTETQLLKYEVQIVVKKIINDMRQLLVVIIVFK